METKDETRSLFAADKKLTFLLLCLGTFLLLYVKIAFIEYETAAFEFLVAEPEGAVLVPAVLIQGKCYLCNQ